MAARNDVTGDEIRSKPSKEYADNWERIFGKKKVTECHSYATIAAFAEELGYGYNQVIDMMSTDRFIPFYENSTKEIYAGYGDDYGLSKDLSKIIDEFVNKHGDCIIVE